MFQADEILSIGGLGCGAVVALVLLLLAVLYQASLARALAACGAARRTLEPGLVWLNLVPLYHLFWKFWTAAQVGTSLRREFEARGLRTGFSFGQTVGALIPVVAIITRCVFWVGSYAAGRLGEEDLGALVRLVTVLLGITELVLLIVHWSQINGYIRQLSDSRPAATDAGANREDAGGARDFDEDYRPVPRRRHRTPE